MFILNFIPTWFFFSLVVISTIVFFITKFFSTFIPYAKLVNYFSILIFSLGLFLTGVNWNNDYWLEKLRIETIKVEQAVKNQEQINKELEIERNEKLTNIQQAAKREQELNRKFIDVLKSKDATVQNVLATLSKAEQDKYVALNAKDKAIADKKLQDVLDNAKNCPIVPELYIDKLNNSARGNK